MALTKATISGPILGPDGETRLNVKVTIRAVAVNGTVKSTEPGGAVLAGEKTAQSANDGTLSVTLPLLPQANVVPAEARWRATFTLLDFQNRRGSKPETLAPIEFELTAATTWAALVDVSGVPVTESLLALVNASRDQAVAAAEDAEAAKVAAQAVGTTNDGIIVGRLNDPTSATAIALAASAAHQVDRNAEAASRRLKARAAGFDRQTVPVTISAIRASTAASGLETTYGNVTFTTAANTFTTATDHGLALGDRVRFTAKTGGMFINGNAYTVRTVPSTTTFTVYASNGTSGGAADVGSDGNATLIKNVPVTESAWVRAGTSALTLTATAANNRLTTPTEHGLVVKDAFAVASSTATGLVNSTRYYVREVVSSTVFTAASTLGGAEVDITADGTAILHRLNPALIAVDGRPVPGGFVSPTYDYVRSDPTTVSVGGGTETGPGLALSTWFDGTKIEGLFRNNGAADVYVYCDGVLMDIITTAALTAAGVGVGSFGGKTYTFPATGRRRLAQRSYSNSAQLVGWNRPAANPILRPVLDAGEKWMFVGDSFTEGTGGTDPRLFYVERVRSMLRLGNVWRCGSGGTGYVSDGARLALIDRYQRDIIAEAPDVCVIAMGINDTTAYASDAAAFRTQAATILDAILTQLPVTELIILGPFPEGGGTGVTQGLRDMDADLNDLADARGLRFISPAQDGLTFTRADATHPDNAGHTKIGDYAAGQLDIAYLPPIA